MGAPPRVLYCDCKHADIISPAVKREVLNKLSRAAVEFDAVSDLCGLCAQKDPALRRIAEVGDVRIAACYPRVVKWLFHAAGARLNGGARVLNMRVQSADEVVAGLLSGLPLAHDRQIREESAAWGGPSLQRWGKRSSAAFGSPTAEAMGHPSKAWIPWFPVIDYDRCENCKQCLSFCLFGVFAINGDGRVEVRNPDRCKTGCPACARVCPSVAIMFPKYDKCPINGDEIREEDLAREPVKVDVSGLLRGDLHAALRARRARSPEPAPPASESPAAPPRDPCDLKRMQVELDIPDSVMRSLSPTGDCDCDCRPGGPCDRECGCDCPCWDARDS